MNLTKTGDFSVELAGHTLEYLDDVHVYLVDGIIVPSVSQLLRSRFGGKYSGIPTEVLRKAAEAGTAVHEAVENFCETGEVADLPEVQGFIELKTEHGFEVERNEVPIIIFDSDEPTAAGRLDLVLRMDGEIGGADIKRTYRLDKEYLKAQLNLYRLGYLQSYGIEWKFLKGIHLRNEVRRMVNIDIDEGLARQILSEYKGD